MTPPPCRVTATWTCDDVPPLRFALTDTLLAPRTSDGGGPTVRLTVTLCGEFDATGDVSATVAV